MEKIKIGFYGYGTRALDALMEHPDFEVLHFLTPASRLCPEVYEAERRYRKEIPMVAVKNRRELTEKIDAIRDVSCFLMNASPIILDAAILSRMDFYNIHPGNLLNNRGHHPHLWSILLDEKETQINLHRVTPEIDLGEVIETVRVPVLPDDTSLTLLNRAEDQIPKILDTLAAYLRGECGAKEIIREGGYRRKVTYEDYRFDMGHDTLRDMDRKIRARAMHSGGFFEVGERRIYADRIIEGFNRGGKDRGVKEFDLTETEDKVILTGDGERAVFVKSKITDKEGKLLWKRRSDAGGENGEEGKDTLRAGA